MYRKDDDYDDKGKLVPSCFRKYDSVSSSFRAHSEFLLNNRRYAFLFQLDPTDYKGWAKGLKKAGYATSSTYANKLIQLIEDYELNLMDLGIYPDQDPIVYEQPIPEQVERPRPTVVSNPPKVTVSRPAASSKLRTITTNDVKMVTARVGDTPEKIALITHVDVKRLIRYNEFLTAPNQRLKGGERIFLQPKRTSFRGRKKYHYVKAGESMFDISQQYGLSLKSLYEKNRLDPGYEPRIGSKIKLRGSRVKPHQKPKTSWIDKQKNIIVDDFEWEQEDDTKVSEENGIAFLAPITTKSNTTNTTITKPAITTEKEKVEQEIIRELPKEIIPEPTPPQLTEAVAVPEKTKPVSVPKPVIINKPKVHIVQPGDTLYRISKNYGLTVAELKTKNDLRTNTISINQRLIVE